MCIKAGATELSSVRALMTMTLNAVVAEVFDLDLDEITPDLRVYADLHMTPRQRAKFAKLLAEYFDGVKFEFTPLTTLDEIFDCVVHREFAGLPTEAF